MDKKSNKIKILLILFLLLLTTGCTKTLTDNNKKPVKNELTGQTLTENILCQPTNKETSKIYTDNGVNIKKLPECKNFKITSGKYEGLWTAILVKPLAFILLVLGRTLKNYGISVIVISLAIRLIAFPLTRKTAMQSELMKKAQPELNKLKKKYDGKTDQESMIKQNQEMMAIYQKYNINPMAGCLFALIQLPIFIAFFEAIQRTPVIFEDKFLGLQLGTTPAIGIGTKAFYKSGKLKNLVIKTKKLTKKTIGANAFKGIFKKAVVKTPKAKKNAYKKIFLKKGMKKTMKFK